jgi:hypothetical protein
MPDCGENKNTALKMISARRKIPKPFAGLALTGLETGVGLVDDINAALATNQLVVTMTFHQTLEGIADFHVHTYIWRKSA